MASVLPVLTQFQTTTALGVLVLLIPIVKVEPVLQVPALCVILLNKVSRLIVMTKHVLKIVIVHQRLAMMANVVLVMIPLLESIVI